MAKTVVGLMDDFTEARAAVRDLAAAGFGRENIGLVGNEKYRRDVQASDEGGLIGSLVHLGVPEEEAHTCAAGVRRGGMLVTVTADTDAMAERAAQIMRSHDVERTVNRPSAANQAAFNERVYEVGGYEGPERRISTAPYAGTERRRLI